MEYMDDRKFDECMACLSGGEDGNKGEWLAIWFCHVLEKSGTRVSAFFDSAVMHAVRDLNHNLEMPLITSVPKGAVYGVFGLEPSEKRAVVVYLHLSRSKTAVGGILRISNSAYV